VNKKTLKANEVLGDIRGGISDAALMEKYKLSEKGLESLFEKLVTAGVLKQAELDDRRSPTQGAIEMAWKCPACGLAQTRAHSECPECGVIVAKFEAMQNAAPEQLDYPASAAAVQTRYTRYDLQDSLDDTSDDLADVAPETLKMEKKEWLLLLGCPVAALICFPIFWLRWTLETFKTLTHEMGHAIFGWAFGYPSFPAFDVIWGGGVTLHTGRSTALLVLIYIGFGALIWLYRKNRATLILLIAAVAIHTLFSFTSIHSVIILFMGHGTELIIAGIFIYRALTGRTVVHAFERPLYGIIGFFIVFADLALAYNLLTSASFREEYAGAKGGDIDMDFVRIAADHLHTSMTPVVIFFLACCLLCLVLSFLAFRYMEHFHSIVAALWAREPKGRAEVNNTRP
jgi:rubredoxin